MQSLIFLTRNIEAHERVMGLADKLHIHARVVTSVEGITDWLSRKRFDLVLIDEDLAGPKSLEIIELAWKHSPTVTTALFTTQEPTKQTWDARLLGTKVFQGIAALDGIESLFKNGAEEQGKTASAVLYVDDLDAPREILQTYITSIGFEQVDSVGSAKEALRQLEQSPGHYFAVIIDIHMPVMNGIQLTATIRDRPGIAHIPIIILTADPTAENVVECVRAGASGFLAKPPKKKELLRELEKAKRMYTLRQSPRLCSPEDAGQLHEALKRMKA